MYQIIIYIEKKVIVIFPSSPPLDHPCNVGKPRLASAADSTENIIVLVKSDA